MLSRVGEIVFRYCIWRRLPVRKDRILESFLFFIFSFLVSFFFLFLSAISLAFIEGKSVNIRDLQLNSQTKNYPELDHFFLILTDVSPVFSWIEKNLMLNCIHFLTVSGFLFIALGIGIWADFSNDTVCISKCYLEKATYVNKSFVSGK